MATLVVAQSAHRIQCGHPLQDLIRRPYLDMPARVGSRKTSHSIAEDSRPEYLAGLELESAIEAEGEDKFDIRWPFAEAGQIDWSLVELLWAKTIATFPGDYRVSIALPPFLSQTDHEQATRILFENHNIPALLISERASCALHATNALSGLFVEVGWRKTDVVPVIDCNVVATSSTQWSLGIHDLNRWTAQVLRSDTELMNQLTKLEVTSSDVSKALFEISDILRIDKQLRVPSEIVPVKTSLEEHDGILDVAAVLVAGKEKLLAKKKDAAQEAERLAAEKVDKATITWRGHEIKVGPSRHRFYEPLFNPSLLKSVEGVEPEDRTSIQELIRITIESTDKSMRSLLWDGLVLGGDLGAIDGLTTLLAQHLAPLLVSHADAAGDAQPSNLQILRVPDYFAEYKTRDDLSVYLGASIIAKLSFADQNLRLYVTKADYVEMGPAVGRLLFAEA